MASGEASAMSRPIPTSSEPWPGNMKAILLIAQPPVEGLRHLLRPFDQSGAPREPGSHSGHQHQLAGPEPAVRGGVRKRERNRARGRVPVTVDVDDDLFVRDPELPRCVVDDAHVGLVRDVQVDVVDRLAALLQYRLRRRSENTRCEPEHLAAVHLHEPGRVVERARPTSRQPQVLAAGALGAAGWPPRPPAPRGESEGSPPPLLDRPRTTAPAPSPNRTTVERSVQSR